MPSSTAMNEPDGNEETLFAAALRWETDAQRRAYLDEACRGDETLRRRVEELLRASEQAATFLENPVVELDTSPTGSDTPPPGPTTTPLPDVAVGQTVGRYKLLEKLGEGGCGVVYVAEQTEPVRRRVALKVIKLGMDTKAVVARFEAERQALALMDHPNIAKVLDAGTTEQGRPFFVMELVRGIPITHYCDQERLTTRQRLDLFVKVCHAIQHAHQKGIIHRDIKPSNILVTLHDGVPVPKVIDFGIAKATEGRLTDATVYTQLHQFVGTPAYMSPEQAEMSGLDIDTRSDIYSLGVLLYELLTGSTPFDGRELMASGIDAMRRTIREKEPARPSTKLATLQGKDLTTAAHRRSIDTARLLHQLQGDLDWIVMKCLEKDRQRRYETANGLAADILRHLANEPVVARPPSTAYRLQKAWQRNRLTYLAGIAVVFALIAGLSLAAVGYWEKSSAQERTLQESLRADQVASFMVNLLNTIVPSMEARGGLRDVAELLRQADTLAGTLTNAPGAELDLRHAIYLYSDEYLMEAKEALSRKERFSVLLDQVPDRDLKGTSRMLLRVRRLTWPRLWTSRTPTEREEGIRELEDVYRQALAMDPVEHEAAATARRDLGTWLLGQVEVDEAHRYLTEGVGCLPENSRPGIYYGLWQDIGTTAFALGDTTRAAEACHRLLTVPDDDSPQTGIFFRRALPCSVAGLIRLGRYAELLDGLRGLEAGLRARNRHDDVLNLVRALRGLALVQAGEPEAGIPLLKEAVDTDPEAFVPWILASRVAVYLKDLNWHQSLKARGIREFSSGVSLERTLNFVWIFLLTEPSPIELQVCTDLLHDLKAEAIAREHWVAGYLPTFLALLEYRKGNPEGALQAGATQLPVLPNVPWLPFIVKYDQETQRELVKGLALARLGRLGEAEAALRRAREAIESGTAGDVLDPGQRLGTHILERELADELARARKGTP